MPASVSVKSQPRLVVYVAAWFLVLSASLLAFLNFNEYPVSLPEVLLLLGGFLVASLLAGFVHQRGARLRAAGDAALAYIAMDLNFDGYAPLIAAVFAAAVVLYRKRSLAPEIAVMFGVVAAWQLVMATGIVVGGSPAGASPATSVATSDKPLIVHIVLDEHIGLDGLNSANPKIAAAENQLREFYISRGFALYERAYSRHFHTTNAIPEILNFGKSRDDTQPNHNRALKLGENAYFDALSRDGYRIKVVQSDFLDYCGHPAVSYCHTHRKNDLRPLANSSLSVEDRARIILAGLISLSPGLLKLTNFYDFLMVKAYVQYEVEPSFAMIEMVRLTSTLAGMDATRHLTTSLKNARPGEAWFAHLLFPHYPYLTRADCSMKPLSQWFYRRIGGDLSERNEAYAEQLACMARKIDAIIDAVAASPAGENAVFILHGDHGSRITLKDPNIFNIGDVDDTDIIASYSTMFAMKTPGGTGGVSKRQVAVSALLDEAVDADLAKYPALVREDPPATIFIEDRNWRSVGSHVLPPFADGDSLRDH